MELIKNNPYRIIGLLVGTTAKEKERQIKRLKQYIEAEQEPENDFSFPVLGSFKRSIETINFADSVLNLDADKMNASLFWFYNGNEITDEPALELLRDGNDTKTIEIWSKLTQSGEVNARNSSAFQNLSTLLICKAFSSKPINTILFEQALILKLKFLESDFTKDFRNLATDETYRITKKDLQISFLNQVLSEVTRNNAISLIKFIGLLSKKNFLAKDEFLSSISQKLIEVIEQAIKEARTKRKASNTEGINIGKALFEKNCVAIAQLKSVLGTSNIQFTSISDKLSEEVLQCAIDYFLHYRDSSTPSTAAIELCKNARSLAVGNIVIQRCEENIKNIAEWIEEKPERDKFKKVQGEFENLIAIVSDFEKRTPTIANAKILLAMANPILIKVKSILGPNDDIYINMSTRIASEAQGMCIAEINKCQEKFSSYIPDYQKYSLLQEYTKLVTQAWDVTVIIGGMDLRQDFRSQYNENRSSLYEMKSQIDNLNRPVSRTTSSGGCYIATMVYGSYDHPQVILLRQFRDNILENYHLGRLFIKIYYRLSPSLVKILKDKKTINNIIRKILNQFIKSVKI